MRINVAIIFLFTTVFFPYKSLSQNKSNRGKEFWLGYGFNRHFLMPNDFGVQNNQELALYISTIEAATVTVSVNNTGWSRTINIPPNSVDATILVPKSGVGDARILTDGMSSRAVHILSDVPVAVYAHQYDAMFSAATMLMPVETYGYSYYSINWPQTRGNSKLPAQAAGSWNYRNWLCYFYVVASEDNTRLQITPSDTTKNGWLPGQTYTVNLNKGEIYNLFGKDNYVSDFSDTINSSKDLTGSKVISVPGADGNCHPFALFSGSGGVRMCYADGGEAMMQQVFPNQAWGTRYLTYHTISNEFNDITATNRNYYRVCVSDPTAIVRRNGVPLTGLINNFYYELMDSTGGDFIESDKPVTIAQFTPNRNQCWRPPTGMPPQPPLPYGDPEMFYLSPIEQGQKSVIFYTSEKSGIDWVYVNIILPTTALSSLRVNGSPVSAVNIATHPNNSNYSVAIQGVSNRGQHTVTCDSTFTAIVNGLGLFESYGYNIGTFINNLNNYSQIQNTLNTNGRVDTFTCPKTPVRLFAKVGYLATSITWKLSQVPGINPNTDSVIANPVPVRTEVINGRTYYVYTLQQDFTFPAPGNYKIPIAYSATVIENCSQTELAEINVLVKPAPPADFSISNQVCLSDTVRFTGTTSTVNGLFNYTSYLWNFDDATTQNTINAKKRFATTGPHDVRYRVYADNGCIGDTIKTVTINNGTGPQIAFTINGKPCVDSTISFTSAIPASANTTYWWDFGDGQTTTTSNASVTHAYAATATNRVVRHTATITGGCSPDTVQQTIPVIFANPAAVPFTITGDTLCPNKPLQIGSTATGITRWNWNLGNSVSNRQPPLTHSYAVAGTYNISLTITDNNGCGSPSTSQPVIISPNPIVNAGPDKFISENSSTTLDATLVNAANYNINWSPANTLNNPSVLNPISTPPGQTPVTYTIQVVDRTSLCTGQDKVIITPISKLYIPTAFTPNGDGRNDKWVILGLALYPDAVVSVYSRWGEKIFETKNYINNPWNGFNKGQRLPIGSYVYLIQLNDDQKQELKGTISIIY